MLWNDRVFPAYLRLPLLFIVCFSLLPWPCATITLLNAQNAMDGPWANMLLYLSCCISLWQVKFPNLELWTGIAARHSHSGPETDVKELCPQNTEVTGISLHFSSVLVKGPALWVWIMRPQESLVIHVRIHTPKYRSPTGLRACRLITFAFWKCPLVIYAC